MFPTWRDMPLDAVPICDGLADFSFERRAVNDTSHGFSNLSKTWTAELAGTTPKSANIAGENSSSRRNDASGTPLVDGRFFERIGKNNGTCQRFLSVRKR